MFARLYRVKDRFTGLKNCSTRRPASSDYLYSGILKATSPDQAYQCAQADFRAQGPPDAGPLRPGDIVVIDSLAYMWLKSGWVLVTFIERAVNM